MSKHPTERPAEAAARRAVTVDDVAVIDQAISAHEGLGGFLYTTRRLLGEIGKLETYYKGLKEGIAATEREGERMNTELAVAKTALTKAQREEVETRQLVAELTAEAAKKEQELRAYSQAIDRITGTAA
jgi:chromosome segregation ATPase